MIISWYALEICATVDLRTGLNTREPKREMDNMIDAYDGPNILIFVSNVEKQWSKTFQIFQFNTHIIIKVPYY